MLPAHAQRLRITLRQGPNEDHDEILTVVQSDMKDCSVHVWFDVFASVLAAAGFSEHNIMSGACQLAFNELRPLELMRQVAAKHDLTLSEDLHTNHA